MGTLKKIFVFLAIIICILALTVVSLHLSSSDTAIARIFSSRQDYLWYRIVGIVPQDFSKRFEQSVIDSYNGKKLVNLVDKKSPSHTNYILIKDKTLEEKFLKGYPPVLVGWNDTSGYRWDNHVAYLINLNEFNIYISDKGIKKKKDIVDKLGFFLSLPQDTSSYKLIKDKQDIEELLQIRPPVNTSFIEDSGYNLVNIQDLDLDGEDSKYYIWLYNKGLVEFNLRFENEQIDEINSKILGFLGNESPSI
jgi:hypothetical protein